MTAKRAIPTLNDVAKAAGVSTATVSRCLNSPERVVEATRERVLSAVERLGYTPNFGARVMAAKRTYTIGAIIPTMENAIFARGVQAFQEELHARGYTLLVSSSLYKPDVEKEQIRALVARGADGLMLIGHARDPEIYTYLAHQQVPVLISWAAPTPASPIAVGFDNRAAMRALADTVLQAGHRSIGFITAKLGGNDRVSERLEGIKEALAHHGLPETALTVGETTYGVDTGKTAFAKLMEHGHPTVVMCANDVLAVGAIKQAQAMGMTVPDDVSITGFDDMDLAQIVTPALTTVHVPHRKMGQVAATELINIIEKTETGHPVSLETQVVQRASLAAPKGT